MSLVGSLEDLGLVDILQIVSLSRKSGVLFLRADNGQGRIVLCEGLVWGASIKGGPETLRDLLCRAGRADEDRLERSDALVREESLDDSEALLRACEIDAETLEGLKREQVESAVMRMFGWRNGEFSFEIRDAVSPEDAALLLSVGLNTQYLAMEATRLGDEGGADRDGPEAASEAGSDEELVFSGEAPAARDETDAGAAVDDAEPDAAQIEEQAEEREVAAEALRVAAGPPGAEVSGPPAAEASEEAVPDPEPPVASPPVRRPPRQARHLIVVDPDLSGLEWLKASVEPLFRRVHIFQRCGSAIDRIRQYLVRGVVPIVVIAETCAENDRDAVRIVPRLRSLSSGLTVLALRCEGAPGEPSGEVDGVLTRPAQPTGDPDRWHLYAAHAERLRHGLEPWLAAGSSVEARRQARNALGRLKRVSERLRDPSSQGEVLSVVLEFAAQHFARVALFMLRDRTLQGIAQEGLAATGGPDDEGMREVELRGEALPELFQVVLDTRTPHRGTLAAPRDRELAMRLGAGCPAEAYVAPIESSGEIVALFYGDNFPEDLPIRDTTAFEIVLHEAGLVLDRAVLERALAAQA